MSHTYYPYANDYVEPRIEIYVNVCTTTDNNIDTHAHESIDADTDVDVDVLGIWGTLRLHAYSDPLLQPPDAGVMDI